MKQLKGKGQQVLLREATPTSKENLNYSSFYSTSVLGTRLFIYLFIYLFSNPIEAQWPRAAHKIRLLVSPDVQLGGKGLEGLWARREGVLAVYLFADLLFAIESRCSLVRDRLGVVIP